MADSGKVIESFRRVVGADFVAADEASTSAVERATFPTTQRIPAIVRPATREEARECVRVAKASGTPLYPISRGKNWGYGSRVPVRTGCVVLDLARLNRILEVDEELAYAVIEPGVTFVQLQQHLKNIGSRLFLSVTGATPDASIIGNALDRGVGKGPCGDRFTAMCNMEVILANGNVIQTGFGRFPGAKSSHVSRASVGPYIDGLFTQSSFGVVTQMTIWLNPLPEFFQTFCYSVASRDKLASLVDGLRELRLANVIRTPFLLANDYRFISLTTQYPWEAAGPETPLSPQALSALKKKLNIGYAWMGDGALYSNTAEHARADRGYIEKILGERVDQLEFWDRESAERQGNQPSGLVARPKTAYEQSMYLGVPISNSTLMTYWRKKSPAPADMDPDRDGCGVLWYAPALPARGTDAIAVTSIVEESMARHGYEANMGLNFLTERCVYMTGALLYDRDVEGEDDRALACYREVTTNLAARGYHPYRVGIQSMGLQASGPAYDDFLGSLARAVDPEGILAPGRYVPR